MAAMLSAVDDGVGAILAEVERLGLAEDTCSFFMADNGPSRETRNWLDGTLDPYYGGTAGKLKGHKFSLYDGGMREPGIMHWPGRIPAGQVLSDPCAAMDIFPTFLQAAGGDVSGYEVDGRDILPYVADGEALPERPIYWEMGKQTAVRKRKWKLVLDGQLVEGLPPEDEVHLSNLEEDMGEKVNLKEDEPELTGELKGMAENWRAGIEERWEREFS
jgi:arylsulfatase A-like enzyme